ncbi:MAG: hypothetical protein K0Q92_3705 [Steroidobacteraceae bacterium]|nr:hypothetical protein [Steroidobacteraceae bacterium]
MKIADWQDVTAEKFRQEILPSGQPAVLRGLVRHWPSVQAGRTSPVEMTNYLRKLSTGANVRLMTADPSIDGRFFYNADLTGVNFETAAVPFPRVLASLLENLDAPTPPAIYAGAISIPEQLPAFGQANSLPLVEPSVQPKIWLSNRVTVQTHYDMSYNIACVVAGHRRFTLFPPEQLANMYMGPLEFTLAGPPISMVRLEAPDLVKYPRFTEALAASQYAELEPGDALFIPYMWWHHVESRDRFNVLVNYWWDDMPAWQGSPFWALMHSILAVRNLSPERREIWRRTFEHLVFSGGDEALAHLTDRQRGVQGKPDPQKAEMIRNAIAKMMLHGGG